MKDAHDTDPFLTQAYIDTYVNSLPYPDMAHAIRRIRFAGSLAITSGEWGDTETIMAAAEQGLLDPQEVEIRHKLLTSYNRFAPVADAIDNTLPQTQASLPPGVTYLNSGDAFHAYLYTDPTGSQHVIKVPRDPYPASQLYTFEGTTNALVRAVGNDAFEQIESMSHHTLRFVTRYVEGDWVASLTNEQRARVPRQPIHDLAANIQDSFVRRLVLDVPNTDNFKYNPAKGFIFIDPHNAADRSDSPSRRIITVRNVIRLLTEPVDTSEEATPEHWAVRLRMVEELLTNIHPDLVDLTQVQDMVEGLRFRAGGHTAPPWPTVPIQPAVSSNESYILEPPQTPGLITHLGVKIVDYAEGLPVSVLRTQIDNLTQVHERLQRVIRNGHTGVPAQIVASREQLKKSLEALITARKHFYAYVASIGMEHLFSTDSTE